MMPKHKVVAFDLDDTLYKEVDFLKSAYHEIADYLSSQYHIVDVYDEMFVYWQKGDNAFSKIIEKYDLPIQIDDLLKMYREHRPLMNLDEETCQTLVLLSKTCTLGLITDGRSLTQRNKIAALGLNLFINEGNILISEETGFAKPAQEPFAYFMKKYPNCTYFYVGDNPAKDFIAPNQFGWETICLLDDGRNVHGQKWDDLPMPYTPHLSITSIGKLFNILGIDK